MDKPRNLPIGTQSFKVLRENNFVYIDKTQFIWNLKNTGRVYFLSRPRRFGKSLLLSTMKAYFLGQKELFKGLAIEKLEEKSENPWQEHPVLYLDFNASKYTELEDLNKVLVANLSDWEKVYSPSSIEESIPIRFSNIIKRAYEKTGKQVVVLVDEYDKPLLQTQTVNTALNEEYRAILKGFYGVLKSNDACLKFAFLTGVSQFSRLSIFSDMNQFVNISTEDAYAEICGLTEEEIQENLQPEIKAFAEKNKLTTEESVQALRKQYDGYRFSEEGKNVYNPFSLLNAFRINKLENFWYATGTPTFLVNLIKQGNFDIRQLEKTEAMSIDTLKNSEPNPHNPIPILFQTGYLTLKEYNSRFKKFTLGFPNDEVRYAFLENVLPACINRRKDTDFFIEKFIMDIEVGNVDSFMQRIKSIISGLPYSQVSKTDKAMRERNYQVAIYLIFKLMGQFVETEVISLKGRADCIVELEDKIYIFEFKLMSAGTAQDAIKQIKETGYAAPYKASKKEIILLGVSFDEKTQNIGEWLYETLSNL